jgi:hypothetical protein
MSESKSVPIEFVVGTFIRPQPYFRSREYIGVTVAQEHGFNFLQITEPEQIRHVRKGLGVAVDTIRRTDAVGTCFRSD